MCKQVEDAYMELVQDEAKATEFFNGILPEKIKAEVNAKNAKNAKNNQPSQPGLTVALPQNTAQ